LKTEASFVMTAEPSLDDVRSVLARHVPLYRWRRPVYQAALLRSLGKLWDPAHRKVLDVGGGTGIIAQSIKELFSIPEVVSVDIEDRYLSTLNIAVLTYDGCKLPFPNGSFDCIVLNNVIHHVPVDARVALLRECCRVATGPIYIKDHLARSALDRLRLTILDLLGNVPFNGMVQARYLGHQDWEQLASDTGCRIGASLRAEYRTGLFSVLFPNRLEVMMRWVPSRRDC
jgi:SAM-dependent methyltransferase